MAQLDGPVPTLSQVLTWLERRADPATAADWDRVGLVTGDLSQPIGSVRFAVDATPQVVTDAIGSGTDLLVTHHPMLLRGVHSIAETTSRGRSLAALVRSGCALFTMHTNADGAVGGVNDALADAVGMAADRSPVEPLLTPAPARILVHVPASHADSLIEAMAAAGAGHIGDYDTCAYWVDGTGQFRPLPGADPHIGAIHSVERVAERRVEMVVPQRLLAPVLDALRANHPYEEPAFSVVPSAPLPQPAGLGRVGDIMPTTARALAQRIADALPSNAAGVRVAGDPDRTVSRVAVCGGSGDSLLGRVGALGVDAYVTSDLRHHPVTDFVAEHDTVLIDIPHASGESLWLATWAEQLRTDAAAEEFQLVTAVVERNTDPWTFHLPVSGVTS